MGKREKDQMTNKQQSNLYWITLERTEKKDESCFKKKNRGCLNYRSGKASLLEDTKES